MIDVYLAVSAEGWSLTVHSTTARATAQKLRSTVLEPEDRVTTYEVWEANTLAVDGLEGVIGADGPWQSAGS